MTTKPLKLRRHVEIQINLRGSEIAKWIARRGDLLAEPLVVDGVYLTSARGGVLVNVYSPLKLPYLDPETYVEFSVDANPWTDRSPREIVTGVLAALADAGVPVDDVDSVEISLRNLRAEP